MSGPRYVAGHVVVSEQLLEQMREDEEAFERAKVDPNYVFPEDWDEWTTLND